jgi:hypothetical protein
LLVVVPRLIEDPIGPELVRPIAPDEDEEPDGGGADRSPPREEPPELVVVPLDPLDEDPDEPEPDPVLELPVVRGRA